MNPAAIQAYNPFDDPTVASRYEDWYSGPGRSADVLEKRLLSELMGDFPQMQTALEIGCGTGHFSRWLAQQGVNVVGLDVSAIMLSEAKDRNGLCYILGDALSLPFADQSFDMVALITTLEFVPDASRALREAVRVARQALLLGVLNKWSVQALKRKRSAKPPWDTARFFSPRELKRLVEAEAGERFQRCRWRTTLPPVPGLGSLPLPWGAFIGMAVQIHPK